jgi:hypothetical protein
MTTAADALRAIRRHMPDLPADAAAIDVGSGRVVAMAGGAVFEGHVSGVVEVRPIGGCFQETTWVRGRVVGRRTFRADGIEGGLSAEERAERAHRSRRPRNRTAAPSREAAAQRRNVERHAHSTPDG